MTWRFKYSNYKWEEYNMTNFEKWNERYKINWCTKEQLQKLVSLKVLTPEDYKNITGEDYAI